MTVLTLGGKELDYTRSQPLDPTMLVKWSYTDWGGDRVMGSLRTIAHIDQMSERAVARFGQRIVIIQPPYNTGVAASAGTHDYDCCRDWYIPGVPWWTQQRFGRANGEGCWYRHPPKFGNHMHGFTLPIPQGKVRSDDFATRVGVFVPGQLVDYYNKAYGLSGLHTPGIDRSWFPKNIDATVFDLNRYIQKQKEKHMEFKDWSKESKDELVARLMNEKLTIQAGNGKRKTVNVKQALARAANGPIATRESEEDIIAALEKLDNDNQ